MGKIKIVWICHFTNNEIQNKLPLWGKFNEFAPWIPNAITGFEKRDDVELHIVAPHIYLKRDTHFMHRGVNYHFLSFGFPILNRPWPSFLALDAKLGYPFLSRKIARVVIKINPDVVNLQGAENAYYSSSILKLKSKFPCVITIQGFACHMQDKTSQINKRRIVVEQMILRSFKYFYLDYDAVHVVRKYSPNMVGKTLWWPAAEVAISATVDVAYQDKRYDVLYCGRMEKSKGIEDFIKIVAILKVEMPNIKACVIGECMPSYFNYLKDLAQELSCFDNIHFIGFVDTQKEMFGYFKASKIMLVPTLVDRYPTTIKEAIFLKIPVIAYCTGNIPWTNHNCENIVLVEHGDPQKMACETHNLLKNKNIQDKLVQSAYEFYEEEFSCSKNVDRFISGYKETIIDFHNQRINSYEEIRR